MSRSGLVLIGSANAIVGLAAGASLLRNGASALDTVEAVIRIVEDNPDDHTVGTGGYPNVVGEVELDASIMDGSTRRAGAVGALRGFPNPISVARQVMERLPHVLLAGEGAARFASECGFDERDLLTEPARRRWQLERDRLPPDATEAQLSAQVRQLVLDPDRVTGTVNVVARDDGGHLASGASTSGWAWKYPGRCGDTGAIGAGNYCDDRYGAAACTGWGELAVRAAGAFSVVSGLRQGLSIEQACDAFLEDLPDPGSADLEVPMHVVALAADGRHAAASTTEGAEYAYWDDTLDAPETRPRRQVRG